MTDFTLHPDWLIPDWPVPAHVHAVCTTRAGGRSEAPYDSLNLGDHVGDDPQRVAVNRLIFSQAAGAQAVFLSQVHGTHVAPLTFETRDGTVADGAQTAEKGLACTVMVADCLPVLFSNAQGTWVAAAHAGWRGLVGVDGQGVLDVVIDHFNALALNPPSCEATDLIAWLGPCIGPTAFEVGHEVRAAFVASDSEADAFFRPAAAGKWWADLAGLARQRLHKRGVRQIHGNDGSPAWCTVSQPSRFFSYRRDGVSGRLAASIWLS